MGTFRIWMIIGLGLCITLFWETPVLTPLKLLIVLIHEMWHGVAAMASGAGLDRIVLTWQESGETFVNNLDSKVGFVFSVSAGYIGSALTGSILLNRGLVGRLERVTLIVFSCLLLYMSFLFTDIGGLAFFVGMGWSMMLLVPVVAGRLVSRYTLLTMGTVFVWYCLYDMFDFTRNIRGTDAGILATYMRNNEWSDSNLESLSQTISLVWCLCMLALISIILSAAFFENRGAPEEPPESVEPEPEESPEENFPGEMTPEIQEWFLSQGLGPDGRPLPPELLELQENPPSQNPVN